MKVLAVLSQKGGAGKTTLALHLATAAEAGGKPCAVIDLDPQASAAGWKDTRPAETPVVVPLPHSRLSAGLQAARDGGAALCIIESLLHRDFGNVFDRWISFDHAIRTNFARPSSFIRLRDLTAIATSVVRRASWRDFMVSPMTRL